MNAGLAGKFQSFFRPRDIFLHDGTSLRRFTIGAKVQMAAVFAAFVLVAWSSFATVGALAAMNSDVARMQAQVASMEADVAVLRAQTRSHAALLERRQAFLASMLNGSADSRQLAAMLPQHEAAHGPATAAYARVDAMQEQMADRARGLTMVRYQQTVQQLRSIGVDPAELVRSYTGMGGPDEPVAEAGNADPRFRELFTSWRRMEQLEQAVIAIPSARPIETSVNFTSGYGVRSDPFNRGARMHGGIDLAGPVGTPIYATADGIVGRSEWNRGGYGNLVELDHGQGIQTRYGHMSRRLVEAGTRVRRGQLIGLMGSTGRSTGSHLHYEVRIDGRAVNPVPFMQSSTTLLALQRRVAVGTPIAPSSIGGPSGGPASAAQR
ncbi:MAG: peptidoglycan DD-metalloendopeptidase family protein [Sphingomonas sp.]